MPEPHHGLGVRHVRDGQRHSLGHGRPAFHDPFPLMIRGQAGPQAMPSSAMLRRQ